MGNLHIFGNDNINVVYFAVVLVLGLGMLFEFGQDINLGYINF